MAQDIRGKVVIVTGGATGLGRAACVEFGSLGAKVAVVTGHNVTAGQETVRLVQEAGGVVTGKVAVLAEGDAADRTDIKFLKKLPLFNADGTVKD